VLVGHSNRQTAERWQHSGSTISLIIHEILESFMRVRINLFIKPLENVTSAAIINNPKFNPFFNNCIGAIDGCHIPAVVGLDEQSLFRNRKGFISQNILAAVNFDMTFSYCLAGWEGSAHDSRVYRDALTKGLTVYVEKYYVVDCGYGLSRHCLPPYRGVRYHLKEWNVAGLQPVNKEELFNLRHSSLRNIVERIFGVIKKRFPILVNMPRYDYEIQIQLVLSCLMIHNFIKLNQGFEDAFDEWDEDDTEVDNNENENVENDNNNINDNILRQWRDDIAQDMWNSYQAAENAGMNLKFCKKSNNKNNENK
jgi:hypothetical protein